MYELQENSYLQFIGGKNFSIEMSGTQIDNCVENCYGMTKGIHSSLDKWQVICRQIYEL